MSLLTATCRRVNAYRHLLCPSVLSQCAAKVSIATTYDSKKFPGYKVLYNLENIKNLSIVNRLKYRMTILSVIAIPGSAGLELLSVIPMDLSQSISFTSIAVTIFLHGLGLFCNNVIGYIYFKPKSDDLIISYVTYWGKRVDINTDAKTISCIESSSRIYRPIFNTVTTESTKTKLKLYIKGKIMDEKHFDDIFGIPF